MTAHGGPLEGQLLALVDLLAEKLADRLLVVTGAATGGEVGESGGSPWMNVATAAAYLDWPRQRLYKLTAQGAIPHYKHDGRLLFHRHELDQWLADFRCTSDWMNGDTRAISR
jgi:excisionase family DNA binding protein